MGDRTGFGIGQVDPKLMEAAQMDARGNVGFGVGQVDPKLASAAGLDTTLDPSRAGYPYRLSPVESMARVGDMSLAGRTDYKFPTVTRSPNEIPGSGSIASEGIYPTYSGEKRISGG